MATVKGQCIPSADRYLYEASLQPATEKSGARTNKYSTVKYKKTTYRSNYYIRMRYPFKLPHIQGADDIHSATLKEIASGDPYPWRKKHIGKPTAKQLFVRNIFKKGVACFSVQPKDGTWDGASAGPRPRPYWYDLALSSELYYYNNFLHKTLTPLFGRLIFSWLGDIWYNPTRRATDYSIHRPQEFIKLDEQSFLDFYVEMTVLYNWQWTAVTPPDEIAHACCKAVFDQITNLNDTPCDIWQTPGETCTLRTGDSEDKSILTYAMIYLTLDTLGYSGTLIDTRLRCIVIGVYPTPHSVAVWLDYESFYRVLPSTGKIGSPGSQISDCPFLTSNLTEKALFMWDKNYTRKAHIRGEPYNPEWCPGYINELYICDVRNHRIQVFDVNGNFKRKWGSYGSGDGQFNYPKTIFLYNNELYVSDWSNSRIQVFDVDGNFKRKWGSYGEGDGQFKYPFDIFITADEVFTTDQNNSRIQVFDVDGNFKRKWGSYGEGDGQFKYPRGLYISSQEVYVGDFFLDRIQVFKTDGTFLRKWGYRGTQAGQFDHMDAIFKYSSKIFVADRLNNRIQVFDTQGNFKRKFGSYGTQEGQFQQVTGLFVHQEEIFVADRLNNRIQVFDTQGNFKRKFGDYGQDNAQFYMPGYFTASML